MNRIISLFFILLLSVGASAQKIYSTMDLHDLYVASCDMNALSSFYETYSYTQVPEEVFKHDAEVILLTEACHKQPGLEEKLIRLAAPYRLAYEVLLRYISNDLEAHDMQSAYKTALRFEDAFGDNEDYQELLRVLSEPADKMLINRLPVAINSYKGDVFAPVLTADDNTLFFCGKGRNDNMGGEDIFYSQFVDGEWQPAHMLSGLCAPNTNEAVEAVSIDGTQMLLSREGGIYFTRKTHQGWTQPVPMPEPFNTSEWQGDVSLTSDGKACLFASKTKGEYEALTSTNIFATLRDANGQWTPAIDLGPTINTPCEERAAYLHPDMKTLYFASEGHGTIGGYDLFMSVRLDPNSWTEWSVPRNLGTIINTTDDECFYTLATNSPVAYFSRREDNGHTALYSMQLGEAVRPEELVIITGHIVDEDNDPIEAELRWENLTDGQEVGIANSDPENGAYRVVLPLGKLYGLYIDDDAYYPYADNFDTRKDSTGKHIEHDIQLVSIRNMVEKQQSVIIKNVFFDVDKWDLLPESYPELMRVAELIKRVDLPVEISGHTDNSGSKAWNKTLSLRRAQSVRDFLIEQGCDAKSITAVGYGDTRPVESNETVEGKRYNRRVEALFKKK